MAKSKERVTRVWALKTPKYTPSILTVQIDENKLTGRKGLSIRLRPTMCGQYIVHENAQEYDEQCKVMEKMAKKYDLVEREEKDIGFPLPTYVPEITDPVLLQKMNETKEKKIDEYAARIKELEDALASANSPSAKGESVT